MSSSLVVLCLAAFAIVATVVSGAVALAMPLLDRIAGVIGPRYRARLWLAVTALPAAVAVVAVTASFLPAIGIGQDHCLAHGSHHPHLCPNHAEGTPGLVVVLGALLVSARIVHVLVASIRGLVLHRDTSALLAQGSERRDGVWVFASELPQAFVLGALEPRVHVSRGLLALGSDLAEPVLAHERVHARRRDPLWRAMVPILAVGHWPALLAALRQRLADAQELAADEEAAASLPDGHLRLAEALVVLTRYARVPAPGLSFTDGDVCTRVQALVEPAPTRSACLPRLLSSAAVLLVAMLGGAHDLVHHVLESVLGALS